MTLEPLDARTLPQGLPAAGALWYILSVVMVNGHRIYLRLGDRVSHRDYAQWGEGTVVQEMTSTVPGGTCLVRILFEDGRERVFHNDLDTELCCYYFGVRKFWSLDPDTFEAARTRHSGSQRRLRWRGA